MGSLDIAPGPAAPEDLAPGADDRRKLQQETARLPWRDLQRFFAQGRVIWVREDRDLIETALAVARDEVQTVDAGMAQGKIVAVPDQQARAWFETNASLWAVVVKPWVLVQETACTSGSMPTLVPTSSEKFYSAPPSASVSE